MVGAVTMCVDGVQVTPTANTLDMPDPGGDAAGIRYKHAERVLAEYRNLMMLHGKAQSLSDFQSFLYSKTRYLP